MYDLEKATPVYKDAVIVGYLFPVNDEYWLPLNLEGNPCGPPSYQKDAEYMVLNPVELAEDT